MVTFDNSKVTIQRFVEAWPIYPGSVPGPGLHSSVAVNCSCVTQQIQPHIWERVAITSSETKFKTRLPVECIGGYSPADRSSPLSPPCLSDPDTDTAHHTAALLKLLCHTTPHSADTTLPHHAALCWHRPGASWPWPPPPAAHRPASPPTKLPRLPPGESCCCWRDSRSTHWCHQYNNNVGT